MVKQYHNSGEISMFLARFLKTSSDEADVTWHVIGYENGGGQPWGQSQILEGHVSHALSAPVEKSLF